MAKDQTTKPQTKPASRSPLPTTEAAAPVMEQLLTPPAMMGQLTNGGDPSLKQAALLQMQRQHGNQFVQRYLANRNGQSGGRTNEPAGPTELPFEEQFNDESGDGPRAFAPPEPPPIQRAEDPPSDAPSDAEKEQALANARAAEAQAGQEKGVAQQEVAVSQEQAEVKKGEKEQAQQKKAAAKNSVGPAGKNGKGAPASTPAQAKGAGPNGAGPVAVAPPTPAGDQAPATVDEDPAFQNVISSAQSVAQQEQTHEPAEQKAGQAQAAAQMPPAETAAHAQANQAGAMEAAETPGFDAAAFKAKLMARIEAMSPRTAQEADQFKGSGKLDAVQSELQGEAAQQQAVAQSPLEQAKDAPPDTGAVPEKPVTPLEPAQPGEATTEINAAQAAPKPKTSGEIEGPIQEGAKSLDEQMAEAEVTEEQLANSNEPSFNEALASKQEAKESAASSPPEYRQAEQAQLQTAQLDAENEAATQLQGMHDSRVGLFDQVAGQQNETVSADEQKRAEIAAQINTIYEETKTRVDGILSTLDEEVASTFSAGAEAAKTAFENFVDAKMEAYKEERYGGMFGWAKWAKDKLLGMPSEVNAFYSEGRTLFLQKMDAVLDNIVQLISAALTEAKAAVAEGRQQINDYVAGLPQDLQEIGAEAAQEVQGRFDELEQQIDDKQGELIESLAQKYTEQIQALDARIEELKAANQGLVQQAFNKIAGVIRTISELKDMLLNVLARAAGVIKAILADPIGFLANLINGIKAGLNQFIGNIGDHLQKGFIGWLTGSLAEAGIELPETFDMAGIFSLVIQVLGISFDKIIGRVSEVLGIDIMSIWDKIQQIIEIYQTEGLPGLAKYGLEQVIGAENVAALIQVVNIIKTAMEGNLAALWELVQTHLTGLKELIFDQIQDFLVTKVIKAGIMWIISMLNPAGAFIRACKAIYDIVMFFIERGSQIMSLVEAIIGAVASLVSGSISTMAQAVENALARAIPVAISFLASLLGLGGISGKVREIIEKVRGLVDRALDAVFNSRPVQAVAGFIRAVIAKMGQLVERGKDAVANMFGGGTDDEEDQGAKREAPAPAQNPAEEEQQALKTIDQEEAKYLQNGKISEADAHKVAKSAKKKQPIFQSISVVDGGQSWDYDYTLQRAVKKGETKIAGLEHLTQDDILKIIRRVAGRIYNDPETVAAAGEMATSERLTQELTADKKSKRKQKSLLTRTSGGAGMAGRARYLRERGRLPLGQREQTTIRAGSSEAQVGSYQSWGTAPIVEGAGKYDALAARLEATGVSPLRLSRGLKTYIRTGEVPVALQEHAALITEAGMLMVGTEGSRNPATLVTVQMTLDEMAKSGSISGAIRNFPMYATGAVGTADTINSELGDENEDFSDFMSKPDRTTFASDKAAEAARQGEVQLAVKWVNDKAAHAGIESFESVDQLEAFIENETRAFYNMRQR